ncbi:MAG TPA: DUF1501 domain-containing protein, partial [Myxococcota bacterium]|nr:DUF1501 domain-containing protein [Myxococcota bacterium]
MRLNRRQFLKGASASAVLASGNLVGFARRARAATPDGKTVVLINLSGGNDYLNMITPLDDVGAPQRSTYEAARPDLALSLGALAGTTLGADPVLGTGLALHPQMGGLATLFGESKLAVVNGVGYPDSSLSHFEAEVVWWAGSPNPTGTGWIGRHLDAALPLDVTHALSFGSEVNTSFAAASADAIGARDIRRFRLPDDPEDEFRDLEHRRPAWEAVFGEARDPASMLGKIARSGNNLLTKSDLFTSIEVDGWGSNLEQYQTGLAYDLRQVSSILRHDLANEGNPGNQSGLSFFHAAIGGFDTHSEQGANNADAWHPSLMRWVSEAMTGFQRDLEALGIADRVVTLTYSEFGRRIEQNDS